MTSFAMVGCGALGGLYGAYLHHAGNEVHFLLHSDFEHVHAHGLRVDSIWGDLHLQQLPIYQSSASMPKVDVVCVCWKSTENHLIESVISPLLHKDTLILFLQNGIGVEEEMSLLFPQQPIGGGLAFLCSNKIGPGHIHHLDYGRVLLGAHSNKHSNQSTPEKPRISIAAISDLFNAAQIPCATASSLAAARWQKLIWNMPYNGLCTLHDQDTSVIMRDPQLRALCEAIMHEVYAAACACLAADASEIDPNTISTMLRNTEKMKPYMPSMQLDRQRGRPLETTYMYQRPIAMAQAAGVAMPHSTALYQALLEL